MFSQFKKQNNRLVIEQEGHSENIHFYKFLPDLEVYNLIYKADGKRFYFKGNGHHSFDVPELFCCALANKLNLGSIQPEPALFVDKNGKQFPGIISQDFIADRANTEIISAADILKFYQFSCSTPTQLLSLITDNNNEKAKIEARRFNNIESHFKAIKTFVLEQNKKHPQKPLSIAPDLIKTLKKQQLFYFLVSNEDCYSHNIQYQITKQENGYVLSLCPVFDNSYTLMLKSFTNKIYHDYENVSRDVFTKYVENGLETVNMPFGVYEKNIYKSSRNSVAMDLAALLLKDEALMEFYQSFKAIKFDKLFEELVQTKQYDFIGAKDIDIATITLGESIAQLERGLQYQKLIGTGPLKSLKAIYNTSHEGIEQL